MEEQKSYPLIPNSPQVQYYINFEVLECSWKELENAVNNAENLDHIIEAHKRFLGIVSERLMLNQEHLQVDFLFLNLDCLNLVILCDTSADKFSLSKS